MLEAVLAVVPEVHIVAETEPVVIDDELTDAILLSVGEAVTRADTVATLAVAEVLGQFETLEVIDPVMDAKFDSCAVKEVLGQYETLDVIDPVMDAEFDTCAVADIIAVEDVEANALTQDETELVVDDDLDIADVAETVLVIAAETDTTDVDEAVNDGKLDSVDDSVRVADDDIPDDADDDSV